MKQSKQTRQIVRSSIAICCVHFWTSSVTDVRNLSNPGHCGAQALQSRLHWEVPYCFGAHGDHRGFLIIAQRNHS